MDELEAYLIENIKAETARVGIDCIKTQSEVIADVAAMLDGEAIRECIQAVCLGSGDVNEAFRDAVRASIRLTAELNLIRKFERGEK